MNGHSGTMSPVSVDGSEWSGINQYNAANKSEPPFSPTMSSRGNLATPPTSMGPPPPSSLSDADLPNGPPPRLRDSENPSPYSSMGDIVPPPRLRDSGNPSISSMSDIGPPPRIRDSGNPSISSMSDLGLPPRIRDSENPSSPSSVAARSSDGTLGDKQSGRYKKMEESAQHYNALRRFLQTAYRDERANMKSNKARDKLLRLSPTQFHELSTDVYDELLRRQQAMPAPGRPPRTDVPPFLPPREDFHEKRNQARQKLASLQQQRFKDLATDVFCELERRFPHFVADMPPIGSPAPSLRGPPSRGGPPNGYGPRPGSNGYGPNGYPPNGFPGGPRSRSQSRGPGGRYPSGGPPPGRFPPRNGSLGGPPPGMGMNGEGNEPLPKSFQSNTIVPNKSTLVEDDDEGAGIEDDYDRRSDAFAIDGVRGRRGTGATLGERDKKLLADTQSQVSSLQEKIEELEELVKSKDQELSRLQEGKSPANGSEPPQEWEEIKADLESKLSKAESLNNSLQVELDRLRTEQAEMERGLRQQLEEALRGNSGGDSELQARFNDLEKRHESLKAELREQREVTEEVRQEASNFLKEMKAMSERSNSNWEKEEKLSRDVHRLEEEVKEWKSRYAKVKTQLRHLRAASVGISSFRPDVGAFTKQNELMQPNGLVKDVHVTKFQIAIDELLRIARSDEPTLVLEQMKAVVVAVRHITQDIDSSQVSGDEAAQLPARAKAKVSATANNLITASKNFANSSGLSPVSLLDAAASHLSAAIVELIRTVKIRSTPDELEEEDDDNIAPMQSPGYFSVAPSQNRMSNNESIYSAISSPSVRSRSATNSRRPLSRNGLPNGQKLGYGMRLQDSDLEELKLYLEDQTEGLVQSIQALVASIRAEDDITTIRSHISAISDVVSNVVSTTDNSMNKPDANPALRERAGPIIQTLADCRDRLSRMGAEGEDSAGTSQLREVTNKLPPIAFEIARETKELVQRVDQIEYDGGEEDDFR